MPETVLDDGEPVGGGIGDERTAEPPAPQAPKGWRWDRARKEWVPRQRAPKGGEDADAGEQPPPDSAWARDDGDKGREDDDSDNGGYVELTDEQRNDVEAILELFALPVLAAAESRDPYCGKELVDSWPDVRRSSLPIIARSPKLVEWMTKAGGARDWVAFAAALRPVGTAIVRHHVTKTVILDEDGEPQVEDLSRFGA